MNLCKPSGLSITIWRSAHPQDALFDFILDTQNVLIEQMPLPLNSLIVKGSDGPNFQDQGQLATSRDIPYKIYSLKMDHAENLIRLKKQESNSQSIWRVLKNNQFYEVKQGDLIKLGLVEFKVRQVFLDARKNEILTLETNRENSSLGGSLVSFSSNRSTGKICRICLDGNANDDDPLVSLCRCSGSVQYTHFSCMKAWFEHFLVKQQVRETIFYKCKPVFCQLCRSEIPETFLIAGKEYCLMEIAKPNCPYLILETQIFDYDQFEDVPFKRAKQLQVVKLEKVRILIGNNHLAQVPIFDQSISKRHAQFRIMDKKLMIKDRQSRFGSTIKIQNSVKFDSKEGITLKYQSMVLQIKQNKSIFNWFENSQQYFLENQQKSENLKQKW